MRLGVVLKCYGRLEIEPMLGDPTPRNCAHCGASFRPRRDDQRFCRRWCRLQGHAAKARAARRTWCAAGRPKETDEQRAAWQRQREPNPQIVALRAKVDGRAIVESLKIRR